VKRVLTTAVALLGTAGCGGDVNGPLAAGLWGGTGASVSIDASGTEFEFDCAHGSAGARLTAVGGRFSEAGVYVREHGGPQREGEEPDELAATYDGEIRANRMTLYIVLTGADSIGPYVLEHGEAPILRKCL
jgi:hypothetical protein